MAMDDDMEDVGTRDEESGEEYDENADEDFNPDKVHEEDKSSSSDDDDEDAAETAAATKKTVKKTTKRKSKVVEGQLDSGDEATIKERKQKKRKKDAAEEDEESGGEGGFIKTRSQRFAEKEERRNRKRGVREGEVTIDVDQVWAELSSIPIGRLLVPPPKQDADDMEIDDDDKENAPEKDPEELITIKRRVKFAGEFREIEEQVKRGSKEAQKYLKEHPDADPDHKIHQVDPDGVQRPMKRPSMFEPNPFGLVKGVPPEKLRPHAPTRLDVIMAQKRAEAGKGAVKMSTVQMSLADWKQHVAKEGLQEELAKYEKSANRFAERERFLDRAAATKAQAARDARLKL